MKVTSWTGRGMEWLLRLGCRDRLGNRWRGLLGLRYGRCIGAKVGEKLIDKSGGVFYLSVTGVLTEKVKI